MAAHGLNWGEALFDAGVAIGGAARELAKPGLTDRERSEIASQAFAKTASGAIAGGAISIIIKTNLAGEVTVALVNTARVVTGLGALGVTAGGSLLTGVGEVVAVAVATSAVLGVVYALQQPETFKNLEYMLKNPGSVPGATWTILSQGTEDMLSGDFFKRVNVIDEMVEGVKDIFTFRTVAKVMAGFVSGEKPTSAEEKKYQDDLLDFARTLPPGALSPSGNDTGTAGNGTSTAGNGTSTAGNGTSTAGNGTSTAGNGTSTAGNGTSTAGNGSGTPGNGTSQPYVGITSNSTYFQLPGGQYFVLPSLNTTGLPGGAPVTPGTIQPFQWTPAIRSTEPLTPLLNTVSKEMAFTGVWFKQVDSDPYEWIAQDKMSSAVKESIMAYYGNAYAAHGVKVAVTFRSGPPSKMPLDPPKLRIDSANVVDGRLLVDDFSGEELSPAVSKDASSKQGDTGAGVPIVDRSRWPVPIRGEVVR